MDKVVSIKFNLCRGMMYAPVITTLSRGSHKEKQCKWPKNREGGIVKLEFGFCKLRTVIWYFKSSISY